MNATESDTVREVYELFQELSPEEVREFFEKIRSGADPDDEYRLNPPWGGYPPGWMVPLEGPNLRASGGALDPDRPWPDWVWPGPTRPRPWPDLPGSPGPTFPEFPEFPEFPSLYTQSTRGSTLDSRAVSQPAITLTARSRPDLREEDSVEIPIDIDATINTSDDPEEISVAGSGADMARDLAVEVVKGFFGADKGGGGGGGGINVNCNGGECTVIIYRN